jgi:Kae1-associated kinase Bud32
MNSADSFGEKMELLKRGAEAELYKTEYLKDIVLLKKRLPKEYRHKLLDEKIRKERIRQECYLLHYAKELGVRTPVIFKVDEKESSIYMEYIRGKRLKDILSEKNLSLCEEAGKAIGRMHSKDLVHGDLTTSNILIHNNGLVFIDFGLGKQSGKTEDKAVDLLVFKKTYLATHYSLKKGWELIIKGYEKANKQGKEIVKHIEAIETRARYH